jgi:hypothetical protein
VAAHLFIGRMRVERSGIFSGRPVRLHKAKEMTKVWLGNGGVGWMREKIAPEGTLRFGGACVDTQDKMGGPVAGAGGR